MGTPHPLPASELASTPPPPQEKKTVTETGSERKRPRRNKRLSVGLVALVLLLAGTLAARELVQQIQDRRGQASVDKVDIALNPSAAIVNPGDTFTVDIVVSDNNNLEVSVVDLVLSFDAAQFSLVSPFFTMGPFFDATTAVDGASTGVEIVNEPTNGRVAIGAVCDQCYLGADDGGFGIDACSAHGVTDPQCYPKNATGRLVTAHFSVHQGATAGDYTIGLNPSTTQVAAFSSDVNELGDVSAASVTVAGGGGTCAGADISADGVTSGTDGRVSVEDYNYLVINWTGFGSCSGGNCNGADISADGVTSGTDGRVSVEDYNYLVINWTGFGSCQ